MALDWSTALTSHRELKEQFLAKDPHSPIPPEERDAFDGLHYYPPDEAYRFVLPLHEHAETEPVTIATSAEGERVYLRWGEFRLAVDGTDVTVQAYKTDTEDERLWIPFRDETNGKETYVAGRYMDLDPGAHLTQEGTWALDFNEAYNPTCAYNDRAECPLPPTENWLDVRIDAGEKAYR